MATCLECGATFAARAAGQVYCSADCRMDWNNRRQRRGAELYDWFMQMRIKRDRAIFTHLCALVSRWRAEDKAERAGRRSWMTPPEKLARDPSILSKTYKA